MALPNHNRGVASARPWRFVLIASAAAGAFALPTAAPARPADQSGQIKRCASWNDIGLPDSGERVTVVKPSYDPKVFADRIAQLPKYEPTPGVSGTVRLVGSDYVGSHLAGWWREAFNKYQPNIKLETDMRNVLISMPSLTLGTADIGVGRAASWAENFMFQRIFFYPATPIAMATGGWDVSYAIFVNKANPLNELTVDQLDRIFFTQRSGAYVNTQWTPALARGADKNIRTWGQLGLKGEWANKPIRLHGSVINAFFMRAVERRITGGEGVTWNPDFNQYETCKDQNGKDWYRQDQVSQAVEGDKFSMGLAYQQFGDKSDLKVLKIVPRKGGPAVPLVLENLYDRSYPLSGAHPMYINRKPGEPVAPATREFLRFILSREGQELVARHGKYIPLTPAMIAEERAKLD